MQSLYFIQSLKKELYLKFKSKALFSEFSKEYPSIPDKRVSTIPIRSSLPIFLRKGNYIRRSLCVREYN